MSVHADAVGLLSERRIKARGNSDSAAGTEGSGVKLALVGASPAPPGRGVPTSFADLNRVRIASALMQTRVDIESCTI